MDNPSDILINKLRERQKSEKLSDQDFAILLGIGRSTWTLIRNRETAFGLKFIAGVTRRYSDMDRDVMRFLREEPGLMQMWAQPIAA
jgi:transcriptional regulator with XRE-family HTH domain